MTKDKSCTELISDDIVRIDIIKSTQSTVPIPVTIPLESVVSTQPYTGNPVVSLTTNPDGYQMQGNASLKISGARSGNGVVYTHDLQATCNLSRRDIQAVCNAIQGYDCHLIYTHADGSHSMSYVLPNTFTFDVETAIAGTPTVTVKVKAQSMSALVDLTTA